MHSSIKRTICIILSLLLLCTGCGTATQGNTPTARDTIRIGTAELSGVFDPWFGSSVCDLYVQDLLFDYLIGFDENGAPRAELADYTCSADGLTYTFTLRDGLTYSDGSPILASDFAFVLAVYADPAYDGFYDFSQLGIDGFEDYRSGSANSIRGVATPDDKTLIIHLTHPSRSAIYSLALPAMSQAYYGADYKKGDLTGVKEKTAAPFGSGQYVFGEYADGQSLTLTANARYWRGTPKIKNCVFSVTPSGMELERARLGETDLECSYAEPDYLKQLESADNLNAHLFPYAGFGYIGLNDAKPQFADTATRQALACAIDRAGVVKLIYGDHAQVVNAPVSVLSWAYDDTGLDPYAFNLERAAKLLQNAGWKKNENGILERNGTPFTVCFTLEADNPVSDALASAMRDSFASLGIEFSTATVDFNTMYDKIFDGTIDMWFGALGFTPDPAVRELYHTDGSQNYGYYSNKAIDAEIEAIDLETDKPRQKKLFCALWQHLNKEMPAIWLYQRDELWVSSKALTGLSIDSYNSFFRNLYQVSFV